MVLPPAPATLAPALFLPVTDPILADGIGLAPRLGEGLGEPRDVSAVLISRRFRGRTAAESESWDAAARALEAVEMRDVEISGSGIVDARPVPSASCDSVDGKRASERGH